LFTFATAEFEVAQVADVVTSCVVLLENVAVAVRLMTLPVVRLAPVVVQPIDPAPQPIAIALATVLETVKIVLAFRLPELAVMVVVPRFTAVARPELLMVAMLGDDELHVAVPLISFVLRSPKVPVAVNCCVVGCPAEVCRVMVGFAGDREIAARSWALIKNLPQPAATPRRANAAPSLKHLIRMRLLNPKFIKAEQLYWAFP